MQVAAVPLPRPSASRFPSVTLADDDAGRASFYAWSAALLVAPPDARCVDLLAASPSLEEAASTAPLPAAWHRAPRPVVRGGCAGRGARRSRRARAAGRATRRCPMTTRWLPAIVAMLALAACDGGTPRPAAQEGRNTGFLGR